MRTFQEYSVAAQSTAIYDPSRGIEYCTLGLASEIGEAMELVLRWESNTSLLKKELGDILWYCSELSRNIGSTLKDTVCDQADTFGEYFAFEKICPMEDLGNVLMHMNVCSAEIAGMVKRTLRGDYKKINPDAIKKRIKDVVRGCALLAASIGSTLQEVAELNIQKLQKRKRDDTIMGSGDNR